MAMTKVSEVTVGSGGAASIEFTNIPQTGKDLLVLINARAVNAYTELSAEVRLNSDSTTANYSYRMLFGDGSSASSFSSTNYYAYTTHPAGNSTTNTFGNASVYISNYTGSSAKSISIDSVAENNATVARSHIQAGRWSGTSAITTVTMNNNDGNFAQHSTASLYIIS